MKFGLKVKSAMLVTALIFGQTAFAKDKEKEPVVDHKKVEQSKVVASLISMADESSDPVFYMAAAKMIGDISPVAITKKGSKIEADKIAHGDIWSAKDLYAKVVELSGAKSELGMQAAALSKEIKADTGEEGCYGYDHYHYWVVGPDNHSYYNHYHYRWHYC